MSTTRSHRADPEPFHFVIIKPSHDDADGYPIQWLRSAIPSNTLAGLNRRRRTPRTTKPLARMWKFVSTPMTRRTGACARTTEALDLFHATRGGEAALARKAATTRSARRSPTR